MSAWLLAIVTLIYAGCALDLALKANWPMATVFAGYAIANLGLFGVAR